MACLAQNLGRCKVVDKKGNILHSGGVSSSRVCYQHNYSVLFNDHSFGFPLCKKPYIFFLYEKLRQKCLLFRPLMHYPPNLPLCLDNSSKECLPEGVWGGPTDYSDCMCKGSDQHLNSSTCTNSTIDESTSNPPSLPIMISLVG